MISMALLGTARGNLFVHKNNMTWVNKFVTIIIICRSQDCTNVNKALSNQLIITSKQKVTAKRLHCSNCTDCTQKAIHIGSISIHDILFGHLVTDNNGYVDIIMRCVKS